MDNDKEQREFPEEGFESGETEFGRPESGEDNYDGQPLEEFMNSIGGRMGPDSEYNENEELPTQEELPAFLREEVPNGKLDQVKYYLMRGKTAEDLIAEGYNSGTVRTAKSTLISEGYLKKEKKASKPAGTGSRNLPAAQKANASGLKIYSKGSPPEAIIDSLTVPGVDGELSGFETGLKFGMSILVAAVRISGELANIGSANVKPLIDMTKSMREGEAQAYKSASDEAAHKAARAVAGEVGPYVANISGAVDRLSKEGPDPVKSMMVRTMEPMMKQLMTTIVPGMAGSAGNAESGDQDTGGLPSGWTKRSE